MPVENVLVEALLSLDLTISVAESLTGGAISARLCTCPGSEDRVVGGLVAYTTPAKRSTLGVTAPAVVSPDAAGEMARGVREVFGTDVGLGVTGVAGPDRQDGEPVGTVFVAWSTPLGDGHAQLNCSGSPEQVRHAAGERALALVVAALHVESQDA